MVEQVSDTRRVIVHVGPHKTGSSALQQCLSANRDALADAGIRFLHDGVTHQAAMQLAREDFDKAEENLRAISAAISRLDAGTVILSQEDFAGDIPGRSLRQAIYPRLARNLRIISRALRPHAVSFVFFLRNEDDWMRSCYHQHLKHRTRFSDIGEFRAHFDQPLSWQDRMDELRATFGERLVAVPYDPAPDAGVRALLDIAGRPQLHLPHPPARANLSPSPEKIRLLERINTISGFRATAWFAKSLILKDWQPSPPAHPSGPQFVTTPDLAGMALPELTRRATRRFHVEDPDDILPDGDADLSALRFRMLPKDARHPARTRADMNNQSLILDHYLRGKSHLAKLNGLTISYLRRDTPHTGKARHLFHRLWREQGCHLVNELPTRWLISTLQTFLDHGENEAQRLIGASGYFYANMMKIYEGERAIEGLDPAAIYDHTAPQTASRFGGLDRYEVGATDLLLNTNALALDMAMRDDVAGLVLIELLLRVEASANVFTRMDRTRHAKGIDVAGFANTWSFFKPQ
ncbi:MAG: hypothetical protein H3C51_06845 [Rubellimicrobium sp.]|nr:hypothetical protein [Rubellimicrobium sp.]